MSEDDKDYDVGYGKPPKDSQYQKGQSGNLNGRPKGSKNLKTILVEELEKPVIIKENGAKKTITKKEVIIRQLVNKAMLGESKSTDAVFRYFPQESHEKGATASQLGEADMATISSFENRMDKINGAKKND